LNKQISAEYACPFETFPPANADDSRITKIETAVCQGNWCSRVDEYFLAGQKVENCGHGTFIAQRRQDQVCLSYKIHSNQGLTTFESCGSKCLQVGSQQVDLYWGNSSVGSITNVATRSFNVSEQQTINDDAPLPAETLILAPAPTVVFTSAPGRMSNGSISEKTNYTWWILLTTAGGGLLLIFSVSRLWSRYRKRHHDYQTTANADINQMELTVMPNAVST
jgi:hypothetical protein